MTRPTLKMTLTFGWLSQAILFLFILDIPSVSGSSYAFKSNSARAIYGHDINRTRKLGGRSIFPVRRTTNVDEELATIYQRRLSTIVGGLQKAEDADIPAWLASLDADGKWPDVDLTTGCEARRASWPAHFHWKRILYMSGAWHGGVPNADQWVENEELRGAIGRAMSYWFQRDVGEKTACLDRGGTSACPCENPNNLLWNTNWFSNIILIPELVAQSCLLLERSLSEAELASCVRITSRTAGLAKKSITGPGVPTGANTLDIAKISVDAGLLRRKAPKGGSAAASGMVATAYRNAHEELNIKNEVKADGIRADGSFSQQGGMLYNGNYGKDYSNAVLELEIAAAGTQFQAEEGPRKAYEAFVAGSKWMIFFNTVTKVLHWDYSVIGRMITFPVAEDHASKNIQTNITAIAELGNLWDSKTLKSFATHLSNEPSTANSGELVGNRLFSNNDYMVHRTPKFVSTLRMHSSRTTGTNCLNSQNKKGLHLPDGALYTYQTGNEYEDVFASWDWDLIPGITVDYRNTPLSCDTTAHTGVESFVGGVSDGKAGVSAMRYTNPVNKDLRFQKTWFFLESGVYHVMVNILSSKSSAPVYSVLDQKRRNGDTHAEGSASGEGSTVSYDSPKSIWHDNIGYSFPSGTSAATTLTLRTGEATGDWADIGASEQPPTTVDLWAAWLEHKNIDEPVEYTMTPGISHADFQNQAQAGQTPVETIVNSKDISAVYDRKSNRIMVVFWKAEGGSFKFEPGRGLASVTITSNAGVAMMASLADGSVVASDPSQAVKEATVTIELGGGGEKPEFWPQGSRGKAMDFAFPTGGRAGAALKASLGTGGGSSEKTSLVDTAAGTSSGGGGGGDGEGENEGIDGEEALSEPGKSSAAAGRNRQYQNSAGRLTDARAMWLVVVVCVLCGVWSRWI